LREGRTGQQTNRSDRRNQFDIHESSPFYAGRMAVSCINSWLDARCGRRFPL
jgi:hypothetical protein